MSTPQQTEEKNINIVRRSIEALNTGDVGKVSEFIHPSYFNHESQASQLVMPHMKTNTD